MYQSKKTPNVTRKATLNNLAKLYIIASQFDLTAKKEEDESYIRTFYDDILMTGKLEQIALNETAKTDAKRRQITPVIMSDQRQLKPMI